MGTTLSALLVLGAHGLHRPRRRQPHLPDRASGRVQQVTEDHTVFNELIKRGKLSSEQIEKVAQKNAITRAVGVYERVEVDTLAIEVLPGDQFVLALGRAARATSTDPTELRALLSTRRRRRRQGAHRARQRAGRQGQHHRRPRAGSARSGAHDERARPPPGPQARGARQDAALRAAQRARAAPRDAGRRGVARTRPARSSSREGERGDELFIVLAGTVRVSRGDTVLTRARRRASTSARWRSSAASPRSATVTAEAGRRELIAIRRADFFEILRKEHELAVKMLWQFLGVLADRLDHMNTELRTAARSSPRRTCPARSSPSTSTPRRSIRRASQASKGAKMIGPRLVVALRLWPLSPSPRVTAGARARAPPGTAASRGAGGGQSSQRFSLEPPAPRLHARRRCLARRRRWRERSTSSRSRAAKVDCGETPRRRLRGPVRTTPGSTSARPACSRHGTRSRRERPSYVGPGRFRVVHRAQGGGLGPSGDLRERAAGPASVPAASSGSRPRSAWLRYDAARVEVRRDGSGRSTCVCPSGTGYLWPADGVAAQLSAPEGGSLPGENDQGWARARQRDGREADPSPRRS